MLIRGCQEGKGTPRLTEVRCPKCGEWVDVFVKMGGAPGQTGTLVADSGVNAEMCCLRAAMKRTMRAKHI